MLVITLMLGTALSGVLQSQTTAEGYIGPQPPGLSPTDTCKECEDVSDPVGGSCSASAPSVIYDQGTLFSPLSNTDKIQATVKGGTETSPSWIVVSDTDNSTQTSVYNRYAHEKYIVVQVRVNGTGTHNVQVAWFAEQQPIKCKLEPVNTGETAIWADCAGTVEVNVAGSNAWTSTMALASAPISLAAPASAATHTSAIDDVSGYGSYIYTGVAAGAPAGSWMEVVSLRYKINQNKIKLCQSTPLQDKGSSQGKVASWAADGDQILARLTAYVTLDP